MSTKKKLLSLIALVSVFSMVLSACAQPTPQVIEKEKIVTQVVTEKETVVETQIVEVEKEAEAVARQGAWLDLVVFTEQNSADAAVSQLQAGDIDVYAYTVNDAAVFKTVQEDENLGYYNSFGNADELTFNPAVCSDTTKLNPFSNKKLREAMNWAMDRNYIAQEIMGGLAVPKYTVLTPAFPDYARFAGVIRGLEAKYAYNLDKAKEVFNTEFTAMGATLVDGKWMYNDAPVTVILLIRVEDERRQIGDYLGNQLEALGFTVDRQYKTRSEASPIWVRGEPTDCLFNIYTGGWINTAIDRDEGDVFSFYYTPRDYPIPLWQAYTPDPVFDELALKLRNNDFDTLEERADLFAQALPLSMEDSVRVWLVNGVSFTPYRKGFQSGYDLAGAVAGAQIWPHTMRFEGQVGGVAQVAQPGIMVDPWNPVAGSNWIYDMMPIRAIGDFGVIYDPYTGLTWPQRIEKAEMVAVEGLPIGKTLDWVDLKFEKEIVVPADAWIDWDTVNQKWITVGEKYTETLTAKTKITVYYPADLFTTVKWHDGSTITLGDFVMGMIMTFEPGKPESPIYDPAAEETLLAFQDHFKGVKIVSTDPLVIETYDDLYQLDAEVNVAGVSWFPMYAYGSAAWHNLVPGILAEVNGELAFSAAKAEEKEIEWMSMISGPSLDILKKYLDQAQAENTIPYAPTLGEYITAEEATARYANLQAWYELKKHFWLGTGPFYLDQVFPVEGTLTLARFLDYPDMADKWARFGTPKIAVVDIEGPGNVTIGQEAAFDVFVTFQDEPYPSAEIEKVSYLVFDATGNLVATGEAELVADGQYKVVLSPEVTQGLAAGSNKLEVAVSSLVVSLPSFGSFEFVTAP